MRVTGIETSFPVADDTKLPEQTTGKRTERISEARNIPEAGNSQSVETMFSRDEIEQAVGQLNKTMRVYNTELHFEVHEKSGEIMVKVLNSNDQSVIREIPPERVLDMVAYFKEILGVVIDRMI